MAFTPNFKSRTLTEDTYNHKKHYDGENIYVVFANSNFFVRVGSTPSFVCYLKQKGEQFGDPLPADISNTAQVILRIYNAAGGIILNAPMTETDTHLGEWVYKFTPLDFSEQGSYVGEIVIVDGSVDNVVGKFNLNAA